MSARARALLAALLTAACAACLAPPALAGIYVVRQCDAAAAGLNPRAEDAVPVVPTTSYAARDRCEGDDQALVVDNLQPVDDGRYGTWRYHAPAGAELVDLEVHGRLVRASDHVPSLYVGGGAGQGTTTIAQGNSNGWRQFHWSAAADDGKAAFSARLRCEPVTGTTCAESSEAATRIRNLRLTVNDVSAPELLLDGSLVASGWRSGVQSLAVSAQDEGGGVRRIEVEVNGATAAERFFDCATIPGHDLVTRMQPCAADQVAAFDLDTDGNLFTEGQNTVEVCAEDFGTDGVNRRCASRVVLVDNEGPGAPQNLHVIGGDDWRAVNEFDIEWENPEQPEGTAQVDGVWYRIEDEEGVTVEGPVFVPGPRIDRLAERQVGEPGAYRVTVWLADQAANADESDAAIARLRFDNVPPGAVPAVSPPGWLGRRELSTPYLQTWSEPDYIAVSGLDGYAAGVDGFPSTNPCETAADPNPSTCAGSEITHLPEAPRERSLTGIPEGSSWVHIAAASGAGLRSTSVTHVEVRADRTDPVTELLGAPAGWTNQPVTLIARATDSLSGMQPEAGDDGQPRTAMQIDGGPVVADPDNEVVHVLDAEGDHEIRFWARDLAGNENDGDPGGPEVPANNQPGFARVRLDTSTPQLGFSNSQDPADPELLRAPASDQLSGLAEGEISYRAQGESTWQPLATETHAGALEARLPSESLADGPYEFQAEASDRAGNEIATTKRLDGTDMVLEVPLKVETDLRADLGSGRKRLTIGYGRESRIEGRLVDAAGEPLGGQSIAVTENFDLGSTESERTREVITDGDGRFALVLPPGPSREIQAEFVGSRRLTDAASPELDLGVRADASLASTEKRPPVGKRFRFFGRVKRAGAQLPPGGKLVELQVKRPEGWDTVRQAFRTSPNGRWRFNFRFGPYYLRPTTFQFRLKVAREVGWPYKAATTGRRSVTVVPTG